jgi:GDP-L-fucose synthase
MHLEETMKQTSALINQSDRIFVAGHRGMAGSAICRALQRAGYSNLLTTTRAELDLENGPAVQRWLAEHKPTVVVLAAARVGGIQANSNYPADFLLDNLKIQTNVIETAWRSGVRRLLFLGSSCIYPKFAEQPIREEALLTGALEPTNEWYAIAKITGIKLCEALRRQHGFDAISLMPTNLYGPGDNYHPENSHVLPALIRRFHEAAQANAPTVTCWGSGSPLREFLHVDDLGEACVFALEQWQPGSDELQFLNVGTGVDQTIRELAEAVAAAAGFQGEIHWDTSKPDGTPKKQLDVSKLAALGWQARIPLAEGLASTLADFKIRGSQRL